MNYTPSEQDCRAVVALLECGLSGQNAVQANETLRQYQNDPNFCQLLGAVFAAEQCPYSPPPQYDWISFRRIAGITLKNNVEKAKAQLGEAVLAGVGQLAMALMRQNPRKEIVRIASQVVVRVTSIVGLDWWSTVNIDLASVLLQEMLVAPDPVRVYGALTCLQYLLEDASAAIGSAIEHIILQTCQVALNHPEPTIRSKAFVTAYFSFELGEDLDWNLDQLTPMQDGLRCAAPAFSLAATQLAESDGGSNPMLMRTLLRAFKSMLDYLADLVRPMRQQTADYPTQIRQMVHTWVNGALACVKDINDVDVTTAACEFLTYISMLNDQASGEGPIGLLAKILADNAPSLTPLLFPAMVMKEEEEVDATENDHYSKRDKHVAKTSVARRQVKDEEGDDEGQSVVSLRKAASETLDWICRLTPSTVLPEIMKIVEGWWENASWQYREVATLALAASVTGAFQQLQPNLGEIVPLLCTRIQNENEHICVTSMALWALSRLSHWILSSSSDICNNCVASACSRMISSSKRVQCAAVTTVRELLSLSLDVGYHDTLAPCFPEMIATIHQCVPVYHTNNLALLCDLIILLLPMLPNDQQRAALLAPLAENAPARMANFSATFNEYYVLQNTTTLVEKDIFDIARAMTFYFRSIENVDEAQVKNELMSWCGVLSTVASSNVQDDSDLAFFPLYLCAELILALQTSSLAQWHQETQMGLADLAIQFLSFPHPEVQSAACGILSTLISILEGSSVKDPNIVANATIPLLDAEADALLTYDALKIIVALAEAQAIVPQVKSGIEAVFNQLRADSFAETLVSHQRLAMLACQGMFAASLMLPPVAMHTAAFIVSTAPNSSEKAIATKALCSAFITLDGSSAPNVLPSMLKLVYSWQTSADPETAQLLGNALQFAKSNMGGLLQQHFSSLPRAFAQQMTQLYGL